MIMRRAFKSIVAGITAMALCFAPMAVASADSEKKEEEEKVIKGYLCFGEDLEDNEELAVFNALGVSAVSLADYNQDTVSNKEEHQYLDAYLDSSVIGTRAISSVSINKAEEGSGITVTTHNINYCTPEMYTNALVTAGFTDVTVKVAAPSEVSGTAALVGVMKAYKSMTGKDVDGTALDTANNELVLTGQLGETIGQDQAAELVALVKNRIVSDSITSDGDIKSTITTAADEMGVSLTDTQVEQLLALMKKVAGLNLDISTIKGQAGSVYEKIKSLNIDPDKAIGFMGKVGRFFKNLWKKILGLFGGGQ